MERLEPETRHGNHRILAFGVKRRRLGDDERRRCVDHVARHQGDERRSRRSDSRAESAQRAAFLIDVARETERPSEIDIMQEREPVGFVRRHDDLVRSRRDAMEDARDHGFAQKAHERLALPHAARFAARLHHHGELRTGIHVLEVRRDGVDILEPERRNAVRRRDRRDVRHVGDDGLGRDAADRRIDAELAGRRDVPIARGAEQLDDVQAALAVALHDDQIVIGHAPDDLGAFEIAIEAGHACDLT